MSNNTTRECKSQYHNGGRLLPVVEFRSKYHKNNCRFCMSKIRKKEREKNKDRVKQEQAAWRTANAEHVAQTDKDYRQSLLGHQVRYESYERNREQKRTYDKIRRQCVPGVREKYNATAAKYRASKKQATPVWFEKEQVEALYHQSTLLKEQTGVAHHVDHIIPLQSDLVCGLHCLANLRVIPATENISKSNKLI